FYIQAEDGIRDFHVTGVQTCALPISLAPDITSLAQIRGKRVAVEGAEVGGVMLDALLAEAGLQVTDIQVVSMTVNEQLAAYRMEIGRASCRGRGSDLVVRDLVV